MFVQSYSLTEEGLLLGRDGADMDSNSLRRRSWSVPAKICILLSLTIVLCFLVGLLACSEKLPPHRDQVVHVSRTMTSDVTRPEDRTSLLPTPASPPPYPAPTDNGTRPRQLLQEKAEQKEVGNENEILVPDEEAPVASNESSTIAFLLPLRGEFGNIGISIGRQMKNAIDGFHPTANGSLQLKILVRDSQLSPALSKELSEHFYHYHGTGFFFGFLSDAEALAAVTWGRKEAPDALFITPTAQSPLLEGIKNLVTIQPPSSVLAKVLGDFLSWLQFPPPVFLVEGSLHTEAFLTVLHTYNVLPFKIIFIYPSTKRTAVCSSLEMALALKPSTPILLLGDKEPYTFINFCNWQISPTWIITSPLQGLTSPHSVKENIIVIKYRAKESADSYLTRDPLQDPIVSLTNASLRMIYNETRNWLGTYTVLFSSGHMKSRYPRHFGGKDGYYPYAHYNLTKYGFKRELLYQMLYIPSLLEPLVADLSDCRVISRYVDEMTGDLAVQETEANVSFVVYIDKGAEIHVDCPHQHVHLRCTKPYIGSLLPACRITLQADNEVPNPCTNETALQVELQYGCTATLLLHCQNTSAICKLTEPCVSLAQHQTGYECSTFET